MKFHSAIFALTASLAWCASASAAPLFCFDQSSKRAEWETKLCWCSCPSDGLTPSPAFITDPEGCPSNCQKDCPCPDDDQSWDGCEPGLCAMAKIAYVTMGSPQPPLCDKGCYDYGVTVKEDASRLNLSCTVYAVRKCSKKPPQPPQKQPSPTPTRRK